MYPAINPKENYGRAGFDVETYSPTDITAGAWMYSRDPNAELLCFAPSIDGHCLDLWIPGQPLPQEWLAAVYGAGHWVVAFNWWFEYCIFNNIMVRQLGLPAYLPVEKFDCVAARNRTYGMPRNLKGTTEALGIPMGKQDNYLMVCKPRKPSKLNPALRWTPQTKPDGFARLYDQCLLDEWGEVVVDQTLPEWNEHERQIFKLDQQINLRGVPIDRDLCEAAIEIIAQLEAKYWVRLIELTDGAVIAHTQTPAIKKWINARGIPCESIAKEFVETMLDDATLPPDVREVLEIRQTMGLESIKKYYKFLEQSDPDTWRVYDQFMYYGAQATGRWAALGCQLHNLPRGNLKPPKGQNYDDYVDNLITNVKRRSLPVLEMLYPNPVALLSSLIRPMITAPQGYEFCVSDYSNIEGRVIFWLAGMLEALDIYRSGLDIYIEVAADIYHITYEQLHADYKNEVPGSFIKRQMGKQAVLGLNYQMGATTFVRTVNGYNIVWDAVTGEWEEVGPGQVKAHREKQAMLYAAHYDEHGKFISEYDQRDAAEVSAGKIVVDAYRGKFSGLGKFWRMLEQAAIGAVTTGCAHPVGEHLIFELFQHQGKTWLRCRFPSGRYLYWFDPRIEMTLAPWTDDNDEPVYKESLTYMKWVKGRYVRETTYGGDIAEGVTQGVARDLLANGMMCAEYNAYNVIMHVHDEVVALQKLGTSVIEHFNKTICLLPGWAAGLPLVAAGWVGKHYRKD